MKKPSGKVAREEEVRAALEVIAGRKISPEVPLPLKTFNPFFFFGTGVGTRPTLDESSFTIWRNLIFGQTGTSNQNLLDPNRILFYRQRWEACVSTHGVHGWFPSRPGTTD